MQIEFNLNWGVGRNVSSDRIGTFIAVAIPCYNEACAISVVVRSWRESLPEGEIYVFDNNSTDETGEIARQLGVSVISVPKQGKGNVVRAIFKELANFDAVILVDGDGTYPASEAYKLIRPILDGSAEMTVGSRRPVAQAGSMSPIRGFGNLMIRAAFRILIGRGPGDLLSGYRVFSRRFMKEVNLHSTGFEIETEITGESVARGLQVVEIPVPYYARIAGTESKLRAFRDGRRILFTILKLAVRLRPERLASMVVGVSTLVVLTLWIVSLR